MFKVNHQALNQAFTYYRDVFFEIDFDLRFWEPFIKGRTDEYVSKEIIKNLPYLQMSVFNAAHYSSGLALENKYKELSSRNIDSNRNNFFKWIENLSCLKIYNAAELFIIQTIYLRYFPELKNPFNNKIATDKIKTEISKELSLASIEFNSTNNKYLLDFIILKSKKVKTILNEPISVNMVVSRKNLFMLMGILRNVIAHHNSILNLDNLNKINSTCKPLFQRHFNTNRIENNYILLYSKDTNSYLQFISLFNDLVLNLVSEILDEKNFDFLDSMK